MNRYFYYSKNDEKKEPICSGWFLNLYVATMWFCTVKCLKHQAFLEIYRVEEC